MVMMAMIMTGCDAYGGESAGTTEETTEGTEAEAGDWRIEVTSVNLDALLLPGDERQLVRHQHVFVPRQYPDRVAV